MRELPEPEGQLAWQTYTRDQVLVIQKQAYEDGLRDAAWKARAEQLLSVPIPDDAPAASGSFRQVLTASQKEQQ